MPRYKQVYDIEHSKEFWEKHHKPLSDKNTREFQYICPTERLFVADRVSGDIPFHLYRSMFLSPDKYLEFLKQLEKSSNRHDFLFWVFDIIAAGQERSYATISSSNLDRWCREFMPYLNRLIVNATCDDEEQSLQSVKFSGYLLTEYPEMFDAYERKADPELLTYENNTDKLFKYRNHCYNNKIAKHVRYDKNRKVVGDAAAVLTNHDDYFKIDVMRGLTPKDFPDGPIETKYEDFNIAKIRRYSFFNHQNYFYGLLTYIGKMPKSTTECILVERDEYKRLQIETVMKKIDEKLFIHIKPNQIRQFFKENATVVVAAGAPVDVSHESGSSSVSQNTSNESGFVNQKFTYKRAKLLCNLPSTNENSIMVFFLDYGEVVDVAIDDIYTYEFDEERVPKFLASIVLKKKLPPSLAINDLLFFNFIEKKYTKVGRPTEQFNPEFNPVDDLDTDTESVYFGKDAPNDWENEESDDAYEGESLDEDDSNVIYGVEKDWTKDPNEVRPNDSYVEEEEKEEERPIIEGSDGEPDEYLEVIAKY